MPSLAQLEEAVAEYQKEYPDDELVIVVDATFGHRIDESERSRFDDAIAHNEMVSPPAGAIGRGDAFLLRIADKVGATVLSNDSFQEFHGEYDWLFNNGRLIGGKPVPGIGWIFTPRTPVRGPKSRMAVADARKAGRPTAKASEPQRGRGRQAASKPVEEQQVKERQKVSKAIEVATDEAEEPAGAKRRRRRGRGGAPPSEPINEPLAFIQFVADHPPGSSVEGEVDTFSSHGAFVMVGSARCYIPLSAMGTPPPRAAREVLNKGAMQSFIVQAIDTPRRGIELALPGFEKVAGSPTDETVEADIAATETPVPKPARKAATRPAKAAPAERVGAPVAKPADEQPEAGRLSRRAKKDLKAAVTGAEPPVAKKAVKRVSKAKTDEPTAPLAVEPARTAAKATKASKSAPRTQFAAEPVESGVEAPRVAALATVKKAAATKAATKKPAAKKPASKKSPKSPAGPGSTGTAATVSSAPSKAAGKKAAASTKAGPARKAVTKRPAASVSSKSTAVSQKARPTKKAAAKQVAPRTVTAAPKKAAPVKRAASKGTPPARGRAAKTGTASKPAPTAKKAAAKKAREKSSEG